MTTDYTGLVGGFRKINDAVIAKEEVYHSGTTAVYAHNQERIMDTIWPRHLVNDWFMWETSGPEAYSNITPGGRRALFWGPFDRRDGMKLKGHIRATWTGTATALKLHFLSSPLPFKSSESFEQILERFEGTPFYTDIDLTSDLEWHDFELRPQPRTGDQFYISMYGEYTSIPSILVINALQMTNCCIREVRA